MTRHPSPATIRQQAATAIRMRMRATTRPAEPVQTPAVAQAGTPMAALPYLARRVLRIVAEHQHINRNALTKQSDLTSTELQTAIDVLLQHQLIVRAAHCYDITKAGLDCVKPDRPSTNIADAGLDCVKPDRPSTHIAAPRNFTATGTYRGEELRHRS